MSCTGAGHGFDTIFGRQIHSWAGSGCPNRGRIRTSPLPFVGPGCSAWPNWVAGILDGNNPKEMGW